jgi:hypothetical protein
MPYKSARLRPGFDHSTRFVSQGCGSRQRLCARCRPRPQHPTCREPRRKPDAANPHVWLDQLEGKQGIGTTPRSSPTLQSTMVQRARSARSMRKLDPDPRDVQDENIDPGGTALGMSNSPCIFRPTGAMLFLGDSESVWSTYSHRR